MLVGKPIKICNDTGNMIHNYDSTMSTRNVTMSYNVEGKIIIHKGILLCSHIQRGESRSILHHVMSESRVNNPFILQSVSIQHLRSFDIESKGINQPTGQS